MKIPSINHIFGQSIDQVEKFCLARLTLTMLSAYYDVSSFISDASISEKIAYKSESIDRLACALENFEKAISIGQHLIVVMQALLNLHQGSRFPD